MHNSLDQALGRPPRPNRVGQSILNIGGDASAAYSLRSLTGGEPKAVRIRRDGDNEERDFTTAEIGTEAAAWTNGLQETALPADLGVTSFTQSDLAYGLQSVGIELNGASLDDFDGTFTPNSDGTVWSNGSDLGVNYAFGAGSWVLNFADGSNSGSISISSTAKYPFQVTNWASASVSIGTGASGLDNSTWNTAASYQSFTPIYGATTTYPTAEAAYSLRKVRSTYTGPAVRIRRTSDDIDADVAFDTNDKVSNDSIVTEVLSGNQSTLSQFLTQNINKLDIQAATGGLVGNVTNVTSTGFDFSVNNEGAVGQQKLFAPSDATTGIYNITFDAVLNSGSLTGITMARVGASENIVEGSNSITLSMTPDVSDGAIFVRTPSTAVANVSITNITLTQTFSGAAVAIWYDQSGNSRNATQISDDNQPLISEDGNLLTAGLKFDGTDDFLATGQSVITQSSAGSFSYFGVSTIATDEAGYIFGSAGNGTTVGSSLYAQDVSNFSLSNGNIVQRDNITRSSGENLVSACYTGGRANLRVNGSGTSVTSGTYSFNANTNFTIGNREDGAAAATFLAGSIKEIIAYNSDQTNNRFKIESNINNHHTIYTAAQNGFVNTWYDQSGNGFNAVADADANEPKIVNSGSLLTDGLKFSLGNNLKLSGTGLDIFKNTQYAQVFYVIKINDTSTALTGFFEAQNNASQSRFLLRNSNATAGRISLGGRRLDGDSFSSFQSNSGHSNAKIVLAGFINYSDEEAFIFKNGTQIGSNTSFLDAGRTSDTRSTNIAIGRASANNTAEFDAEELIIFNISQAANQTAIETNMINHYGIIS
jgi:hypothetical protein